MSDAGPARVDRGSEPPTIRLHRPGAELREEKVLRALLLTDLVDSTKLHPDVLRRHDRLARELLSSIRGREIDKSDGFLFVFDRPIDAARYAIEYHNGLVNLSGELKARLPGKLPPGPAGILKARAGIHFGELTLYPNTPEEIALGAKAFDPQGQSLAIVARIMSLAQGGQTLLSESAFKLAKAATAGEELDPEVRWVEHGLYRAQGLDEPLMVYEVGIAGRAPLMPPPDSEKAVSANWRPAPERQIPGRKDLTLLKCVGRSAFGEVWRAQKKDTGEVRAVRFCDSGDQLPGLQAEVQALERIHERLGPRNDIVRVYDVHVDRTPYCLVTDDSPTGNLAERFARDGHGPLESLNARIDFVRQSASAVAAAHRAGVVHAALQPECILIVENPDGSVRPKVSGFTGPASAIGGLKQPGVPRLYRAPELDAGSAPTEQSDIFALGVLLYQMVVGDLARALAHGWERDVRHALPSSDEILAGLLCEDIAACVAGEPSGRMRRAGELAERLAALERRRSRVQARRSQARQARRQIEEARRRRIALRIAYVVMPVLLLAAGFALVSYLRSESARKSAVTAEYFSNILLAQHALDDNDVARTRRLLAKCPADLRGWEWRRLEWVSDNSLAAIPLAAHAGGVTAVARSQDESLLASAGSDGRIVLLHKQGPERDDWEKVWEVVIPPADADFPPVEPGDFEGDTPAVAKLAFSPDARLLLFAGGDSLIRVLKAFDGSLERTLDLQTLVYDFAIDPAGSRLVACGRDSSLQLFDVHTGQALEKLNGHSERPGHAGYVLCVAWSPDGTRIASAGNDRKIIVWQRGSATDRFERGPELADESIRARQFGIAINESVAHEKAIRTLAFGPDSARIISGSADRTIKVWTPDGLRLTLDGHDDAVNCVASSPDGERILSAGADATLRCWDARNGDLIWTVHGHTDAITSMALTPPQVTTASRDGTVRLWDATDAGGTILTLAGHYYAVRGLAVDPTGEHVVSASKDKSVKLWNLHTGAEIRTFVGHRNEVACVAFAPDGVQFVSGGKDGTLRLWHIADPNTRRVIDAHGAEIVAVDVRPGTAGGNPGRVLTASRDGTAAIWNAETGRKLASAAPGSGEILAARFSGDGRRFALGTERGRIEIRDSETGAALLNLQHVSDRPVGALAYSPDGHQVVGAIHRSLYVWDARSGELIRELGEHKQRVTAVAFHPSGARIVSVGDDGLLKLWDLATGRQILALRGDPYRLRAVAVSPDGERILAGGDDTVIRVWESRPIQTAQIAAARGDVMRARRLLRRLASEYYTRSEVEDAVRRAPVDEEVRALALGINRGRPEQDAGNLNELAWSIVKYPGQPADSYGRALDMAQAASKIDSSGRFLNTLGVALYRNGQFAQALETLLQSKGPNEGHPADLAFIAMSLEQLGRHAEAEAEMGELYEAMENAVYTDQPILHGFVREAESLVLGAAQRAEQ